MEFNWIGPVLGAIVGLLGSQLFTWARSRTGDKVLITRKAQTNEINVSELLQKDLDIKYKGVPAKQLVVNTFEIINKGDNNLGKINFSFAFEAITPVQGFFVIPEINDPLQATKLLSSAKETPLNMEFERPFLNKHLAHKDERVVISLISDAKLKISVSGGGPGWSIEYDDITNQSNKAGYWFVWVGVLSGILAPIILSILGALGLYSLDITTIEGFSGSLIVIDLVVVVALLISIFIYFRIRRIKL